MTGSSVGTHVKGASRRSAGGYLIKHDTIVLSTIGKGHLVWNVTVILRVPYSNTLNHSNAGPVELLSVTTLAFVPTDWTTQSSRYRNSEECICPKIEHRSCRYYSRSCCSFGSRIILEPKTLSPHHPPTSPCRYCALQIPALAYSNDSKECVRLEIVIRAWRCCSIIHQVTWQLSEPARLQPPNKSLRPYIECLLSTPQTTYGKSEKCNRFKIKFCIWLFI